MIIRSHNGVISQIVTSFIDNSDNVTADDLEKLESEVNKKIKDKINISIQNPVNSRQNVKIDVSANQIEVSFKLN